MEMPLGASLSGTFADQHPATIWCKWSLFQRSAWQTWAFWSLRTAAPSHNYWTGILVYVRFMPRPLLMQEFSVCQADEQTAKMGQGQWTSLQGLDTLQAGARAGFTEWRRMLYKRPFLATTSAVPEPEWDEVRRTDRGAMIFTESFDVLRQQIRGMLSKTALSLIFL